MISTHGKRLAAALFIIALTAALLTAAGVAAEAVTPAKPSAPEMALAIQSCNDAYDQTGVGGAGIGQIRHISNGAYSFSITFNQDFIETLPPTTDFLWGQARVLVDGAYAFSLATGHTRPVSESFHSRLQLQGHPYGPRNRKRLHRGDRLTFQISLLLVDPVSWTFYPGHGTITCEL